jgi:hypothetical protein
MNRYGTGTGTIPTGILYGQEAELKYQIKLNPQGRNGHRYS